MWVGDLVAERFAIERPAGSGGMGSVFRALDRHTGTPVAVKVMDSSAIVERFHREARVLAELRHPAIVSYVAHGEGPNGEPYLVMEWLEGEDLALRLKRGPLSVADSLALTKRAAEALCVAHSRRIVHRDIKPSNLVLVGGEPEQVKVVDFGVARAGFASHARTRTRTGAIIGTVGYMSPEQAMGEADVDAATDIFALGCVLFECLTGRAAFAADHPVAVLAKVLKVEPPPASELAGTIPKAVDGLLRAMLAKERVERLPDGHALLTALEALEARGIPMTGVSEEHAADSFRDVGHTAERAARHTGPAITETEQRFVSIILARLDRGFVDERHFEEVTRSKATSQQ